MELPMEFMTPEQWLTLAGIGMAVFIIVQMTKAWFPKLEGGKTLLYAWAWALTLTALGNYVLGGLTPVTAFAAFLNSLLAAAAAVGFHQGFQKWFGIK